MKSVISKGKKVFIIGAILVFAGLLCFGATGDVNNSGNIDINDALMVARYSAGLPVSGFVVGNADVNCDSSVNINDALVIARYTAGQATICPGTTITPTPTPTPGGAISIACGSSSAVGSFQPDQYYSGGSTYNNSNTIDISQITSDPPPAALFNNERYGAMSYTIPGFTAGGTYTVILYFVETYLTSSGSRVFNVSINGTTVLSNFDIYASAGGQNKAVAQWFTTTANASGQIIIQFTSITENPKINGIRVQTGSLPTPSPTPTPTFTPTPTMATVKGSEVLLIGDSVIALSHEITNNLNNLARSNRVIASNDSFREAAVSGTRLAGGMSPTIPQQYANAKAQSAVKWVIMDGGGNDCLQGSCPNPVTSSCPDLANAATAARNLLNQMGTDGIKGVIYFFYYDATGDLQNKLNVLRPMIQDIVTSTTSPKCYWLDLRPIFAGHPEYLISDGIHPSSSGSQAIANAIWDIVQRNNFFAD